MEAGIYLIWIVSFFVSVAMIIRFFYLCKDVSSIAESMKIIAENMKKPKSEKEQQDVNQQQAEEEYCNTVVVTETEENNDNYPKKTSWKSSIILIIQTQNGIYFSLRGEVRIARSTVARRNVNRYHALPNPHKY